MESDAIDEFRRHQTDSPDLWDSPSYCKQVHETLQRLLQNDAGKEAIRVNIEWAFGLRLLGLPRVHPKSVDIIANIIQHWLDDRKFVFVYDPIKDPDRFALERNRWRQLMTVSTEKPTEVDVRVQIFSSSYIRIFSRIHDVKALFADPIRGIVQDVLHFVHHSVTHSARVDVLMTIMHMGLHKPNKRALGDPSLGVVPVLLSVLANPPEHFATCAFPQGNFTDCRIHSAEALMTLAVEPENKRRFAEASLGLLTLLGSIIKEDRTLVGLRCLTVLTNMSVNTAVSQTLLSVSSPYCIVQYLVPVLLLPPSQYDPVVPFAAKAAAFLWNCCERQKQAFFPLVAPSLIVQLTNAVQQYLQSLIDECDQSNHQAVEADVDEDVAGRQHSYRQAMSSLLNMIMNLARWEEARPLLLQSGLAKTVSQLLQVIHEGTTKSASPRASSSTADTTPATTTATKTTTTTKVQLVAPHSALHYKLLLILAFLVGKEEHSNTAFPSLRYEHVQGLVHILQTVVQEQAGVDFDLGTFCLPVVLHGIRTLMISDSNKQLLLDTTIIPLAIQALALFLLKKPAITTCGGGGDDVDSAVYALEVLMHMAFAFADTEQLQVVYCQPVHMTRDQITVRLEELLPMVPTNELLDDSSKRLAAHLAQQLRLPYAIMREDGVYDHPSIAPLTKTISTKAISLSGDMLPSKEYGITMDTTTSSVSTSTTTTATTSSRPGSLLRQKSLEAVSDRRHVMISYSWQANKPYVEALTTMLYQEGIDVWRDEVGSSLVGPLAGSLDDAMAKAIEVSAMVIIVVSEAYKASANCRYEASYVSQLAKRQQLTMKFVMVNEQYTTVSQPRCCDGWLGLLIGCDLWFPMWQESQIAQTCRDLLKHIPAACRRQISSSPPPPPTPPTVPLPSSSSSSSVAPGSNPPVASVPASLSRSSSSLVISPVPVPDTRLVTPDRRSLVRSTGSMDHKLPSVPQTVASRSSVFSPHSNTDGGSIEEAIWTLLSDERRHLRSSDVFELLDDLGVIEAYDLPFIAAEEWDQLLMALKPVPRRRLQVLIAQFPST